jgi:hypothetical protein
LDALIPTSAAATKTPQDAASASSAAATEAPPNADPGATGAVVVYTQPQDPKGGLIPSSWRDPDGSDADRWIWENFGFENAQTISEVRWYGGYDSAKGGSGGPVHNFTVDIFASIPFGTEPSLAEAPLAHFSVGHNAEETLADVLGGVQTYAYRYVLPIPLELESATTYWIQIEAFQAGDPDWGLSIGSGTLTDGRHFRTVRSPSRGTYNQLFRGDAAIEFLASAVEGSAPIPEIVASMEDIAAMLANLPPPEQIPVSAAGIQEIMLIVSRSGYTPLHFAVKAGVPARLTFRQLGYVPGGNELLFVWGARDQKFVILTSPTDTKVVEFTPREVGEFRFSCPHDWYEGVMTVQE